MKKGLLLFVALVTSAVTLFAQPMYNKISTLPAPPPSGQLRPVAEWEPAEAVLIRYPFGIPMSLIKAMAEDIEIITIVASNPQKDQVLNQYNSNGVNTAHCQQFVIAPTDTYWTRDYGPWFVSIDNNELAMFDFNYNRVKYGHGGYPREDDNKINQALAGFLSSTGTQIERYDSQLYLTGGNYMNDGIRMASSTTLIPSENPEYQLPELKQQFQQYLGLEEYHFIPDPIYNYDAIQHIDCWGKLLAPDKVLIAQVPQGTPNYNKFEAAKDSMEAIISSYGTPMQVFRVQVAAVNTSTKTPFTNSLILNNKVFVPIGGNSSYNDAALKVYQQAMPGYTIIPVQQASSTPWYNTDALHCRTHEIADRCMLHIKHQPLFGEIANTGNITFNAEVYSYCGSENEADEVMIYLKHSGGAYQKYDMTSSGDNKWTVTVSGLPSDTIKYYVFATKDETEKQESHPYISRYAPDDDFHTFVLTGDVPGVPVLVLDKTSSSVTSEGLAVIEDFITVSNAGTADLTFNVEIPDIDLYETFLTITPMNGTLQPYDNQPITLSYDFAGVENGEYTGSFNLISNDPAQPVTEISWYAYQNHTGIADPTMSVLYIYPNPAQNVIYVYYNDDNAIKAHIYNVLGQQLKETTLTKEVNTIDIQELLDGVYFLKIGGNAFKFIKR